MMTNPSQLSQYDVKQSNEKNNNSGRGAQLLSILSNLLINIVIPFLVNILARPHMSTINALLLASAVPAVYTLGGLIVKKRIEAVGILVVAGMLLSAAFALLFNSPRLLLIQTSSIMGLFGVVMLISLLFPKPILFYLARSVLAQHDPQRFANFNAGWSLPQYRSFYKTLTAAWGCVTVVHLLLQLVLAFTLPISLMLVISNVVSFVIITPLLYWSRRFYSKNKAMFDQLRQQR